MATPGASRRRAKPVMPFIVAALVAASSPAVPASPAHPDEPAPRVRRLALRPLDPELTLPGPVMRQRIDLVRERELWRIDAPAYGVAPWDGQQPGPGSNTLWAASGDRLRDVILARPGELDLRGIDRVQLLGALHGEATLELVGWLDGEVVARSERERFALRGQPDTLQLRLVPVSASDVVERLDRLEIHCHGSARRVQLRELRLLQGAARAELPDAAGGPRLFALDGDSRRAVLVRPGQPLVADVVLPAGALLGFSVGRPPEVPGQGRLLVELWEPDFAPLSNESGQAREGDAHGHGLGTGANPGDGRGVAAPGANTGGGVHGGGTPGAGDGVHGGATPSTPSGDSPRSLPEPPRGLLARRSVLAGDDWSAQHLALSQLAGRPARLHVRAVGGPVLLAEASLTRLSDDAPTVLFITSDTHRGDHGPGGHARTPVLDQLARDGVAFDDAWAPINNTTPAHASLFTGRHPRDTGVLDNYTPLADAAPTLVEAFADAGWLTWAVVASRHLAPDDSGLGQGFDRVRAPHESSQRSAADNVDELLRWLPEAEGRPLFVWLHLFDAHIPYDPAREFLVREWDPQRDPFAAELPEPPAPDEALPQSLHGVRDFAWPRAAYRAEVSELDAELARLLTDRRLRFAHVALVGDHGEAFGELGSWFGHEGLSPATLHVPLVLAGPGLPQGRRVAEPVSSLDVAATLARLAGLGDDVVPGRDLRRALGGDVRAEPRFALEAYAGSASVEHEGWLLVLPLQSRQPVAGPSFERHRAQLYHVAEDPFCKFDLSRREHEHTARLRGRVVAWLDAADDLGWDGRAAMGAEALQQLAQLGYVAPSAAAGPLWVADDCDACKEQTP